MFVIEVFKLARPRELNRIRIEQKIVTLIITILCSITTDHVLKQTAP